MRSSLLLIGVIVGLVGFRPGTQPRWTTTGIFDSYRAGNWTSAAIELERIDDWPRFISEANRQRSTWDAQISAAFLLEAAAAFQDQNLQDLPPINSVRDRLLRSAYSDARRVPVSSGYELNWLLAAAALVQGTGPEVPVQEINSSAGIARLFEGARRRLHSPELDLSCAFLVTRDVYALAAEGWYTEDGQLFLRRRGGTTETSLAIGRALSRFQPLSAIPATHDESALQIAFLRSLEKRTAEASIMFSELETSSDRDIAYVAALLHSRLLLAAGRIRGAIDLLAPFVKARPNVQSGTRLLAVSLYLSGQRQAADDLVDSLLGRPVDPDPWNFFSFGEYRHWPDRLQRLRTHLR